jgi:ribulose-phosphate 3-epimerase
MSGNPGFGGQTLIPSVLRKARELRAWVEGDGLDVRIEIDGGVTADNVPEVAACGVEMIVVGNAIFGDGKALENTRRIVQELSRLEQRSGGPR